MGYNLQESIRALIQSQGILVDAVVQLLSQQRKVDVGINIPAMIQFFQNQEISDNDLEGFVENIMKQIELSREMETKEINRVKSVFE